MEQHHPRQGTASPRRRAGCQGFSLTELLIVTVLMLVMVGGTAWVLVEANNKLLVRSDVQLTRMMETQRALNRLGEDLRRASFQTVRCTNPDPALTSPLAFTPAGVGGVPVSYWRSGVGPSATCPSCCVNCLMRYQGPGSPFQVGAVVTAMAGNVTKFGRNCAAGVSPSNPLVWVALTTQTDSRYWSNNQERLELQVRLKNS